jgi:hypothetical protein
MAQTKDQILVIGWVSAVRFRRRWCNTLMVCGDWEGSPGAALADTVPDSAASCRVTAHAPTEAAGPLHHHRPARGSTLAHYAVRAAPPSISFAAPPWR